MLSFVPESFSIAQVTPYPWEMHHEVNRYVERHCPKIFPQLVSTTPPKASAKPDKK